MKDIIYDITELFCEALNRALQKPDNEKTIKDYSIILFYIKYFHSTPVGIDENDLFDNVCELITCCVGNNAKRIYNIVKDIQLSWNTDLAKNYLKQLSMEVC